MENLNSTYDKELLERRLKVTGVVKSVRVRVFEEFPPLDCILFDDGTWWSFSVSITVPRGIVRCHDIMAWLERDISYDEYNFRMGEQIQDSSTLKVLTPHQ